MMASLVVVSPYLVPLFGIAVTFVGYRKHEDIKFAGGLSLIALAGCFVATLRHEMFDGYTMAATAGITGISLLGYALYHRRHISD
jgi:hypothetical protein